MGAFEDYLDSIIFSEFYDEDEDVLHYGMPRRSGRYPWGSGKNPRRNRDFISTVARYKEKGMGQKEIAEALGMSTYEFRKKYTIAINERKKADIARAIRLYDKYHNYSEVARIMGKNESSVRDLLNPSRQSRQTSLDNTAQLLRDSIADMRYIDVGKGIERYVGVSKQKLDAAVQKLEAEGYKLYSWRVRQVLDKNKATSMMVLAAPDVEWDELSKNRDKIGIINGYTEDNGMTIQKFKPVQCIDSSRVFIKYAEDGGIDYDGGIEIRRGVEDLDLGNARYAQVRIGVDDKLYLKGMAYYSDDIPEGYDIVFNTNKHRGTPIEKVLKPLKEDADGNIKLDDPTVFGAEIRRQRNYISEDGTEHTSALNIVNEEGDWGKWSKNLPSQFLSKQMPEVAKQQLDLKYLERKKEYDDIMQIENPALRKKMLLDFGETCDSDAVELKAAAMPRQSTHVLIPVNMPDGQIYAPNYENGEKVVLVRFPHAHRSELPELTVNNNYIPAKKVMGNAIDGIGINSKTAAQLSGADFDGDTALVIPNNDGKIVVERMMAKMEGFDPKESYPLPEGKKKMTAKQKQTEMGKASNLITDMTIRGASDEDEYCRAMKYSMVVIDAEKHKLDWKQAYQDFGIAELKEKYQGGKNAGASTLISKASAQEHVYDRIETGIDPETGKIQYREKMEKYKDPEAGEELLRHKTITTVKTDKNGNVKEVVKEKKIQSTKMYEKEDAMELSSGTYIESIYGKFANDMKALGNQSRKEAVAIEPIKKSKEAEETFAAEVASLNYKLNEALKNAPLERKAQLIAQTKVYEKTQDNDLDKDQLKKLKRISLAEGRAISGADKSDIIIEEREMQALNAGAFTNTKTMEIFNHANPDRLRELISRKSDSGLSDSQIALAKAKLADGYSRADVAKDLGVSASTIAKYVELPDRDLTDTTR